MISLLFPRTDALDPSIWEELPSKGGRSIFITYTVTIPKTAITGEKCVHCAISIPLLAINREFYEFYF